MLTHLKEVVMAGSNHILLTQIVNYKTRKGCFPGGRQACEPENGQLVIGSIEPLPEFLFLKYPATRSRINSLTGVFKLNADIFETGNFLETGFW
jgi:hypothetical protein